jgi:hypothetical protein
MKKKPLSQNKCIIMVISLVTNSFIFITNWTKFDFWLPLLSVKKWMGIFLCPRHTVAGTYSVTHVRNSEIKQLWPLFFAILWDIDLIFGMWVYNDKLQIKFTFRSSPIIFGQVMALGLWNLAKYLVVTIFFRYAWRYCLDFWYMSV